MLVLSPCRLQRAFVSPLWGVLVFCGNVCFPLENRDASPVPADLFLHKKPKHFPELEKQFLLLARLCSWLGGVGPRAAPCPGSQWLYNGVLWVQDGLALAQTLAAG